MTLSAPSYAFNTTPSTFTAGPFTVPLTGAAVGDLLIINLAFRNTITPAILTAVPTGWAARQSSSSTSFILYKTCTAADLGTSVSVTFLKQYNVTLAFVPVRTNVAGNRVTLNDVKTGSADTLIATTTGTNAQLSLSFSASTAAAPGTPIADTYGHTYTLMARQPLGSLFSGVPLHTVGYLAGLGSAVVSGMGFSKSTGTTICSYTYVTLNDVAGIPLAPTITSPAPGAFPDATAGVPITATYTPTNGAAMSGYVLRYDSGATYYYWTGSAWTTTLTVVALTVAAGSSFTVTPTIGAANGPTNGASGVYNLAVKEVAGGYTSTYSTVSFTCNTRPTVSVTAPAGIQPTPTPTVSWTGTYGGSASQRAARVVVFTAAQYGVAGFDPATSASSWDSAVVTTTTPSLVVGSQLPPDTYRAYVSVIDTNGVSSTFNYSAFTVSIDLPSTPAIASVTATNDTYNCLLPTIIVNAYAYLNLLTLGDSTFNTGSGAWVSTGATSVTLGTSSTHALEGTALTLTPSLASGAVLITSGLTPLPEGGVPTSGATAATPLTAQTSLYGAGFVGTVTLSLIWYNAIGTSLSTTTVASHTLSSSAWTTISGTIAAATVPSTAAAFRMQLSFTSTTTALAFYVDACAVMVGSTLQPWSAGGFGTTSTDYLELQATTDGVNWYSTGPGGITGVTFNAIAGPGMPMTSASDTATPPSTPVRYRARTVSQVNGAGPYIASAWSASSAPVTGSALGWWYLQDLDAGIAVNFVLASDPTIVTKELGTVIYPLGRTMPVTTTDGWKGRVGSLTIALSATGIPGGSGGGTSSLNDLLAIITSGHELLLWSPSGASIKCVHDPAVDLGVNYSHTTLDTSTPFTAVNFGFIEIA